MANLTAKFYIALSRKKQPSWELSARLSTKQPSLEAGERLMVLNFTVPAALFSTPQLEANVTVPESSVSAPVIKIDTINRIQEIVSQEMGVELKISLVEPKDE